MPTSASRPSYFEGEYLTTGDYVAEQTYQDGLRRAHDGALHTWGIASGLEVTLASGQVNVAAGVAVDPDGELVVLGAAAKLALPKGGETVLVLTRRAIERPADRPDGLPTLVQAAELSWAASRGRLGIVLATLAAGPTLDASSRRYVGMEIGAMTFTAPSLTTSLPSIAGWGAQPAYGLRITADELRFSAPGGADAALAVLGGLVGVGTMSPEAALDVQAPNEPNKGIGLISSVGSTVTGSSPAISALVEAGDLLIATDRKGRRVTARVLSVVPGGRLEVDSAMDVQNAEWELRRKYVARFTSDQGAVFVGDDVAYVGIGATAPAMRLEIRGGDLLVGDGRTVSFEGSGQLVSADGAHAIVFDRKDHLLAVRDAGTITLDPGSATSALTLLANGDVGLGTTSPENPLEVEGTVYATDGYVFPDGSVQIDAGVTVPIGGIIDWWRAPGSSAQVPLEYRICDGSTVYDTASPFHTKSLPNLGGYFIRGCASQAEAKPGPSASATHTHGYAVPAHTHPFPHAHPQYSGTTEGGDEADGPSDDLANQYCHHGHTHTFTASISAPVSPLVTGPNNDAGGTAQTGEGSSIPPYYGLLKLMRIR